MRTLNRLFRLFVPYRGILLLSAVFLLLRAGVELVPPLVQKRLIDDVIGRKDLSRLSVLVGTLSFFERTSTGELMSRVTNDINVLEQFVTHGTALTLVNLIRYPG